MSRSRERSERQIASTQIAKGSSDKRIGRRQLLKLAATGAVALHSSHWFRDNRLEAAVAKRPNIVFIFDDQYRQDMSKFIATPAASRLAREGTAFANSLSVAPLCTPFRGMLMTGRFPTHSGLVLNWVNASPVQNPNCLANVFDKAGYNTGFLGKWHLAAGIRVADGLYQFDAKAEEAYRKTHPDTEYVPPGPARLGFKFWQAYNFHGEFNDYWYYEDAPQKIYSKKYQTDTLIGQAIDYIEEHKDQEKPFLLVIAPHPPHPPFTPRSLPEGYLDQIPKADDLYQPPNVPKAHNPRTAEELRIYLAMAKNFDDNLGRLMDYLDRSGVGQNTLLVFTADHGEMHGSHGRNDKMVPYAEAVNIPLIMRWPWKIPAGVVRDTLYTPIDHLPTLCGLATVKAPSEADGEDLSEVVLGRGRSYREQLLMANYTSHWDFFQTGTKWPEWRGVHTKRYTYVKWLTGDEELYDNLEDPFQLRNLAREDAAKSTLLESRGQMKELMIPAHDDFLSGRDYAAWYDNDRNLIRTALGPVHR